MITYKTQAEIEKMRRAGQVLFAAMKAVKSAIRPGVTTAELDSAEKNKISHRGQAFRKLAEFLKSQQE